jgi:anti-sigma-K factor RskA
MTDADDKRSDDIALAGEYALRLLDGEARRTFEARLTREPALRELLRQWDEGLVTLTDDLPEVEPPGALKRRIEERLFATSRQKTRGRFGLFGFLGGAVAAFVLAVVIVAFLPLGDRGPAGPVYTAEIAAEDQSLIVQARYEATSGTLALERVAGAAAPGRVLELWLIAEGAPAPVSLGVLPDATTATLTVPAEIVTALAGGTLAISDEPPGGSPTGQPTGAVLALGPISTL